MTTATRTRTANWKPPAKLERVVEQWLTWVVEQVRGADTKPAGGSYQDRAHRALTRKPYEPADPCLAAAMAGQSRKDARVMQLHMLLKEYPLPYRIALVGSGMGKTQAQIAAEIGCSQPHAGTVLRLAYDQLEQTLRLLAFLQECAVRR